jgi:hypothetical protein
VTLLARLRLAAVSWLLDLVFPERQRNRRRVVVPGRPVVVVPVRRSRPVVKATTPKAPAAAPAATLADVDQAIERAIARELQERRAAQ